MQVKYRNFVIITAVLIGTLFDPLRISAVEFEPGLITKVMDRYVSINLGAKHGLSVGDTLWVYREQQSKKIYVGVIKLVALRNTNSGAEILYKKDNETLEILDRVYLRPDVIDMTNERYMNNFSFAKDLAVLNNNQKDTPQIDISNPDNKHGKSVIPSSILFTVGGIGVGVTATTAALALYHDYKSKYGDSAVEISNHNKKYRDFKRTRNIAGISSAAVLVTAIVSHYLNKRNE